MGLFCGLTATFPRCLYCTNQPQTSTTTALHIYPLKYIPSYIFPSTTSSHPSAPTTSSSPILPSDTIPSQEPNLQKDRYTGADTHNLVQQMLDPLINNTDVVLAPAPLFLDLSAEIPYVEEEEDAKQKPPPPPTKEWTKVVYTFQDVQTQAHLCTQIGEMQKQGLRMIDIMDVRTLTKFISKSMWCWADDHPR